MKFSIVMPVYNSSLTLSKSIGSILEQTYIDWELVAVDDGSIDNSLEILENYVASDDRIIVYHQDNAGPGVARNNAIRRCSGDYIAFLDSDDYWDNSYLQFVLDVIDETSADVIFIDSVYERQDGTFIKSSHIYSNKSCKKHDILCKQMTGIIPWGMGKVFKRSILAKISSGFTEMAVGEEAIFSFDIVSAAEKIGYIKKPIYHYVQSSQGQHKKGNLDPWSNVVFSMKNHLIEIGCYDVFETNINSLALRAFCICVNRCALLPTYREYKKAVKEKMTEYESNFNLTYLNDISVDIISKTIYFLLRFRIYLVVYIAAKTRKKKLAY